MINKKIFLIPLIVCIVFLCESGTIAYATNSEVSLGVNVLSVGPATINDFDYRNVNFSQEITDSDAVVNENTNLSADPLADTGSIIGSDGDNSTVSKPETTTDDQAIQDTSPSTTLIKTESTETQGKVLGARTERSSNWFKRAINKCSNFFKTIFRI